MSGSWNETIRRILADANRTALSRHGRLRLIRAAPAALATRIVAGHVDRTCFLRAGHENKGYSDHAALELSNSDNGNLQFK